MRCSRWLCMLIALAVISVLAGCGKPEPAEQTEGAPEAAKPVHTASQGEESWSQFVADAREKCKTYPGCSVDYEAYHEYEGYGFGLMVVGWKDSEYTIDLYRWNSETRKWDPSPTRADQFGFVHVDLPSASEQWSVPLHILQTWMDEAEVAMTIKGAPPGALDSKPHSTWWQAG